MWKAITQVEPDGPVVGVFGYGVFKRADAEPVVDDIEDLSGTAARLGVEPTREAGND